MILESRPADFDPKIEVVGCYLVCQGKMLLLQRIDTKTHGGQWGLPAGKIDDGEDRDQAVVREIFEETGLNINADEVNFITSVDVRNNGHDLVFHIYRLDLESEPPIKIESNEHQDYRWVTPEECDQLDYVHDLDGCNNIMFN